MKQRIAPLGLMGVLILLCITTVEDQAEAALFGSNQICGDRLEIDTSYLVINYSSTNVAVELPFFLQVKIGPQKLQILHESTQNFNQYVLAKALAHNSCSSLKDEFSHAIDRYNNIKTTHGILTSLIAQLHKDGLSGSEEVQLVEAFNKYFESLIRLVYEKMPEPVLSRSVLEFKGGRLVDVFTLTNLGNEDLSCAPSFPRSFLVYSPDGRKVSAAIPPRDERSLVAQLADLTELPKDSGPIVVQKANFTCNSKLNPQISLDLKVMKDDIKSYVINVGLRSNSSNPSDIKNFMVEGVFDAERSAIASKVSDAGAQLGWGQLQLSVGNTQAALASFDGISSDAGKLLATTVNSQKAIGNWGTLAQEKVGISESAKPFKFLNQISSEAKK
ncbi:MAG: hypothetical protein EPO61_01730 [Nitrospirae bacterium]|nr:MAG: hypothetical protein EPO61_01730 [Nitrospirota bacterium]